MSRQALAQAREEVALHVARGQAPRDLLQRLANEDRVALAEVVVGPRAPASPLLVAAALEVLPALEQTIAPKALYQRLVSLAAETRGDVLAAACQRHPVASWLVKLAEAVEGPLAGLAHLEATSGLPVFARVCQLHAEAGHQAALLEAVTRLGRPELPAQLAAAGHLEAAAAAVVRCLERDPASPALAWAAAGWGPDLSPLRLACVRCLRDARTAQALAGWLIGDPRASSLLGVVRATLPAMPPTRGPLDAARP